MSRLILSGVTIALGAVLAYHAYDIILATVKGVIYIAEITGNMP